MYKFYKYLYRVYASRKTNLSIRSKIIGIDNSFFSENYAKFSRKFQTNCKFFLKKYAVCIRMWSMVLERMKGLNKMKMKKVVSVAAVGVLAGAMSLTVLTGCGDRSRPGEGYCCRAGLGARRLSADNRILFEPRAALCCL